MAQTVHLMLKIDGNDIEGESTVANMDRENTIECLSFESEVSTARESATGMSTGCKQHKAVVIRKRIDKSTPLLLKALCENEKVDSAEFRFYRPSPSGDGTEEHFYTVLLEECSVGGVRQLSEDAIMAGESAPPMLEEVSFVFQDITWTYEDGGATHTDSSRPSYQRSPAASRRR